MPAILIPCLHLPIHCTPVPDSILPSHLSRPDSKSYNYHTQQRARLREVVPVRRDGQHGRRALHLAHRQHVQRQVREGRLAHRQLHLRPTRRPLAG